MSSVAEESKVKIQHTEKPLKSRFIRGRREISAGGGMLGKRVEAGSGEVMTQEINIRNHIFTFAQANCQNIGTAQFQDVLKMLNMRG